MKRTLTSPEENTFVSLHAIDTTLKRSSRVNVKGKETAIAEYVEGLVDSILRDKSNRIFKFRSNSTEVSSSIDQILRNDFTTAPQIIADRLLSKEQEAELKYKHITNLLKGSLVQAFVLSQGDCYFLIAKLDHHAFLDEVELVKRTGLPYDKKVLKAALVPIINGKKASEVKIYDTNARIAEYWWLDFLELEELRSDGQNTLTAFQAIDSVLSREIGKKSKHDYLILRNATVFFFRNVPQMDYNQFVSHLLDNYEPTCSEIDVPRFKQRVLSLPQVKSFDTKFGLDKSVMKARQSKVISLRDNLELRIKADVTNLDHIIQAYDENGVRGIKIKSDEGWNYFKK